MKTGNGANFQHRIIASTATARLAGATAIAPYWLKLVKSGNSYTSFKSKDGSSWIPINTTAISVPMGNSVKVGLAITSTNNSLRSVADFDNFSITKTLTEPPVISPNGVYFQISRQVTLSTSVPGSHSRYTINGDEPTETSIPYTAPFNITASCTVKAKTFKNGYSPSPASTALFNQPGLMVKYYSGSWTTLPDFSTFTPYKVSMIPNIDYPDNYGHIMTSGLSDNVGAVITGQVNCPVREVYTFYLLSGEGATLYIDGKRLIYSPKLRTFAQTASAATTLAAGLHDIRVEYFESTGSGGLQLKWSYPGQLVATIPPASFFSQDTDADGLPDQWEIIKSGNMNHSSSEDTDGDGVSDKEELNLYFTDPSGSAEPFAAAANENTAAGIAVTYCAKNNRIWTSVPDFDRLPHYAATIANQLNYPMSTAKFATSGTPTNVATRFTGFIDIPADGFYKFYLNCDDGANLYVDNRKIVDSDGLHTMRETYGFASLKTGKHEIRVDYYQTVSYNGLILSYEGPGLPKQIVPASGLFHSPKYLQDMINANDPDSDGINTINASAGENGTITPSGASRLEYGANQSYAIAPDTNYRVSDVLIDGISVGAVTTYQFSNVKRSHTISANFALNTHSVTFNLAGKGERSGGGELNQTVNHWSGALAPTVTANAGWTFTGWEKPFNNITADTAVTARYSRITYTVTFIESANGTITGTKVQAVNHGDSCETVTAAPNTGYHFLNWTGDLESTDNPLTVLNVTSNKTITANFAINTQDTVPGALFGMGYNEYGELGDGTTDSQSSPIQIVSSGVTAISAGSYHSLFLKNDGSLWAMGYNSDGQLGDGTTTSQSSPTQILPPGTNAISAGGLHSLFLKNDGSLWAMGYNYDGELGDGTTVSQSSPVQIVPSGVAAISAGYCHSLFLKNDGSLWGMGNNEDGQLGDETTTSTSSPVQIMSSGVTAISAGGSHSLFLKDDGSLWGMGYNADGELGDGTTTSRNIPVQIVQSGVTSISAGGNHSLFLKDDGSLWGMGYNADGELGDGTTTSRNIPVQIVQSGVIAISAGACHSLFLMNDGSLWVMGYNGDGELGDGTTTNQISPVQIVSSDASTISAGNYHSLYLKTNKFIVVFLEGSNGSISGSILQEVKYGKSCSVVTAVPLTGYHFVNWTMGEVPYVADVALTVTNVTNDMVLTANFSSNSDTEYTVNFIAGDNGSLGGTASQKIYSGCSGTSVTGIPSIDYHFVNWTGIGGFVTNTDNPLKVLNVTSDMSITANFASNSNPKYTVNFISGDNGSIEGTASQLIYSGESGTSVTAIPATGYHFVNWTGTNGYATRADNPLTVSNVTSDMSITANFTINTYTLCYTAEANGTIRGTTPQAVNDGASGTEVIATPSDGYHFVAWSDGMTTATRTDIAVTADKTVSATFAINIYTLTYVAGSNGFLSGETTQAVRHGEKSTPVTAAGNIYYLFDRWTGNVTSTDNPLIVSNITSNMLFSANFKGDNTIDSDSDGLPDWWEIRHEQAPNNPADASLDSDGDGLSNIQEYVLGTNPQSADSDNDGLSDSNELQYGTNPNNPDTDGDGASDGAEVASGTNPNDPNDKCSRSTYFSVDSSGRQTSVGSFHPGVVYFAYAGGAVSINGSYAYTWNTRHYDNRNWMYQSNLGELGMGFIYGAYSSASAAENACRGLTTSPIVIPNQTEVAVWFQDTRYDDNVGSCMFYFNYLQIDALDGNGNDYFNGDYEKKTKSPGLVVSVNKDNDDYNSESENQKEKDCTNKRIDGDEDKKDMAKLVIRKFKLNVPIDKPQPNSIIRLKQEGTGSIRVFKDNNANGEIILDTDNTGKSNLYGNIQEGDYELLIEGVEAGETKLRLMYDNTIADEILISVINIDLLPDWNRDGVIDDNDRGKVTNDTPWRFWINDNIDNDATSGIDHPVENGNPNCGNNHVDSVRDLVDFFPVQLNIKDALLSFPPDKYDYVLRHDDHEPGYGTDGAFNAFIDTGLSASQANHFLVNKDFCETNAQHELVHITSAGYVLPQSFLDGVKNEDKDVILLEGCFATTKPLVLELRSKVDQKVISKVEMPVSIDTIDKMFRHKNLRGIAGGESGNNPERVDEPMNYPDESGANNIIFIHGYNNTWSEANGAQCAVFKRLFWSGSKAKFHGITWRGDDSRFILPSPLDITPNYHVNALHAFETASALSNYINGLNGGVAVMAHSLGNMLASAAISLYGANVDTYFIIDGAVAKEAFNPGEAKENKGGMERVEWDDYCYEGTATPDFLFSSEWFRLFAGDPNDPRGKLTWRGLFQDMNGATCYNFYSSGEEVLDNIPHDKGNFTLIDDAVYGTGDISLYCWGSQEKLKGRMLMNGLVGSNYAGWGFNGYYYSNLGITHMSPGDAGNINPEQLKTNPFFYDSPSELFSQDTGTAQTYALNNRFEILAKAIPARSFAIGRNPISKTGFTSQDMMAMKTGPDKNWWPSKRLQINDDRWMHSDFKNVAYLYTFNVYDNIVNLGGLK